MSLFWIVVFFFVLLVLQAAYFKKRVLARVDYRRSFSVARAYAGETFELTETVTNAKRLPVPWLRLETALPAALKFHENVDVRMSEGDRMQHHRSFFSLASHSRLVRRYEIRAARRGVFSLETVHMTGGDVFGLVTDYRTVPAPAEVVVYPALLPRLDSDALLRRWNGERAARRWLHPDPFLVGGIRSYRPGDAVKDIHWRATARMRQLMVKERDFTASPEWMVILTVNGWRSLPRQAEESVERAFSVAATLIMQGMKNEGVAVGFACDTFVEGRPGSWLAPGAAGAEQMLEKMARAVVLRTVHPDIWLQPQLASLRQDAEVLLIGCVQDDGFERVRQAIRSRGIQVEPLIVEAPKRQDDASGSGEEGIGHEAG